jgi:hypothetical protein
MNTDVNLYLNELFLEREMFQTKVVEKIEPLRIRSVTFFLKIISFMW